MNIKELIPFLNKRWNNDSKRAFLCRIARFGVIACFYPSWQYKSSKFDGRICSQEFIHGSWMILYEKDKGVSRELLINKTREPYAVAILPNIIQKGNTVVDIGANIGYYALQECSLVGNTGHVYAIEPVSTNIQILNKNIKLNHYENISTYKLACGEKNTKGNINVSVKGNWSSLSKSLNRTYLREEEVDIVTLDKFLIGKPNPQLIRMDVEGYEYNIVLGMKNLLESKIPLKLLIEVHFDILMEKVLNLFEILQDYGFEISMASIEPHPWIIKSKLGQNIVKKIENGIGPVTGYNNLKINDILENPKFSKGQVEYMEILFERN